MNAMFPVADGFRLETRPSTTIGFDACLGTFRSYRRGKHLYTAELYPHVLAALQISSDQYSLASLRYDLSKLRAKALVEKLPKSRRYRLQPQGYSICLEFLKLFERVYSPLTIQSIWKPYFGLIVRASLNLWTGSTTERNLEESSVEANQP